MHLLLRPIFCQSHPNFINVCTAYTSEIWAQLTKNLLTKSSTKRFREYILFMRNSNDIVLRLCHVYILLYFSEIFKFFVKFYTTFFQNIPDNSIYITMYPCFFSFFTVILPLYFSKTLVLPALLAIVCPDW